MYERQAMIEVTSKLQIVVQDYCKISSRIEVEYNRRPIKKSEKLVESIRPVQI